MGLHRSKSYLWRIEIRRYKIDRADGSLIPPSV
jgi:hypothetical protein